MSDAPPKTLTITFDEPIKFNGASHTEVTLREPTVHEYEDAATRTGYGVTRHLLTTIGKLSAPVANLVPISKVVEADAFFGRFLRPAPPPGPPEPEAPQDGDAAVWDAMELREPTIAEMEAAGAGPRGTAKLVSLVTGIPFETALRMPISVSARADAYFAGFVSPAPATGNR